MDKILIVDSSAQNTELMQQCLDNAGYEILTAESGLNAYAKVQLFKPDLVILDADLPDVSGYDICKKIKASADTQYILVLIVSMFESRDSRVRAVEVGADDFIEKTFDAYILLSKCKSLLRIKHLGDQLKQKYTELEEKNNLLDFQLKTGRQVQHTLIPELDLKFQGARIMSRYMPALDIGGDFYNFIPINEHCFSIVMGDVSGHGISAALLTAMVGTMVRNLAAKYFNPDQLMYYLNSEFCSIFENSAYEMYACVFYAVIDTKRQKIFYTNGGQCLPVYARAATGEVMEMESTGLPVGLLADSRYEFKSMDYRPGDLVLFHTDGLSDAFYKDNPEKFSEMLRDAMLKSLSFDNLEDICDLLLGTFYNTDLRENKKYDMDDVSFVVCRL